MEIDVGESSFFFIIVIFPTVLRYSNWSQNRVKCKMWAAVWSFFLFCIEFSINVTYLNMFYSLRIEVKICFRGEGREGEPNLIMEDSNRPNIITCIIINLRVYISIVFSLSVSRSFLILIFKSTPCLMGECNLTSFINSCLKIQEIGNIRWINSSAVEYQF